MASEFPGWEWASVPVIVALGTVLHFAHEWSGRNSLIGVIAPVNESVWEHLKMAYWPAVAYVGLEAFVMDSAPEGYIAARAVGVYTMGAVMLGLYYLNSALLRQPSMATRLVADGITFIVAVATGQFVGQVLIRHPLDFPGDGPVAVAALAAPAVVLGVTTFWPPHLPVFRDQLDGTYGAARRR